MLFSKKTLFISVSVLLLLGGISLYFIFKPDDAPHKQAEVSTTKSTSQPNVKVTVANDTNSKVDKNEPAEVAAPSGVFVSNHKPNLGGSPTPNSINSTCHTSPNISCEIQFSKNGVVKVLGPNTTGSDGYVSWDWKLQDIGITEGTWQITAVAKSGNNTNSTKDQIMLEVSP